MVTDLPSEISWRISSIIKALFMIRVLLIMDLFKIRQI